MKNLFSTSDFCESWTRSFRKLAAPLRASLGEAGENEPDRVPQNIRRMLVVAVALFCVAVVSKGVHDVAIEHLGVPYPTLVNPPLWLPTLSDIVRLAFLVMFCVAARRRPSGTRSSKP